MFCSACVHSATVDVFVPSFLHFHTSACGCRHVTMLFYCACMLSALLCGYVCEEGGRVQWVNLLKDLLLRMLL